MDNVNIKIDEHYLKIQKVLLITLILNWVVAIIKIIYGSLSKFTSITADGYHSLSDGASNIIGIIGIYFACKPIDKDHPYGHKKYETLFSLSIAIMLIIVAYNLLMKGLENLHNPGSPKVDIRSFLTMIITLVINVFVVNYEYKMGKKLSSDILISDSMHTKADILVSLSVMGALVAIKMGYPIFDPIITIVISFFIAYTGYEIIKTGSDVLCDTAVFLNDKKVSDIVMSINGVRACHKIRTRGRLDDIHIDLHVQVKSSMPVQEAHKISYSIEEVLKKNIPEITDVIVHIEPE